MGVDVVQGDEDRAGRMLLDELLEQLGDLASPFALAEQDHRLAGVIIDGSNPVSARWLSGGANHDLLPLGTPHPRDRWHPTDIELVRVVEHIPWLQAVPRCFDRLVFTSYSGSGLLILC